MEKNEKLEKTQRARQTRILMLVVTSIVGFVIFQAFSSSTSSTPSTVASSSIQQQHAVATSDTADMHRGAAASRQELPSEAVLEAKVVELDQKVRDIKATGVFMEVDPEGLAASKRLQDATRLLLAKRYGKYESPYRVRVDLTFQESNPTTATMGEHGSFVIELAPVDLVPHSVYSFLEIARHWPEKRGAFHRRANHVLQVQTRGKQVQHLAFQEYSPQFPHVKGTVGYAGRPSGPHWYVSIQNNAKNHGPGSQQAKNPHEADSCFGKVIEGFDDVVVKRVREMPGMGFLNNPKDHVLIDALTILVPSSDGSSGEYVEWTPSSQES